MKKYLVILLAVSLGFISCKKEEELVVPVENVNPPENNNEILGQKIIPSNTYSSIYKMISASVALSPEFVFYGTETPDGNGRAYVLKKVNVETGNIVWSLNPDMNIYKMVNMVNSDIGVNGDIYVLFGGKDIDGNGSVEYGVISTVDKNGKILDTKSNIDNNYTTCYFACSELCGGDYTTFVALGRAKKDKISYPLAKAFKVDYNGKIMEGTGCADAYTRAYIDFTQPNKYYHYSSWGDVFLLTGDGVNEKKSFLQKLNIRTSENPVWEKEITTSIYGLDQDGNGGFYLCGEIEDEVSPKSASNTYWSDGIVYKYNSTGSLVWKQIYRSKNVSGSGDLNYDDKFQDIMYNPENDCVYAVGRTSSYFKDSKYYLGNALMAKYNCSDGKLLSSYSLGDKSYQSSFNTVTFYGDKIVCGGYTKQIDDTSGFQNWIVRINQ